MLRKFQRDFAAAITAPVQGPMRVYRNTFLSGCTDALRANFPAVEKLLGDEMFEEVAAEFALQCPPSRPVLALYGGRFAGWLKEQSWVRDTPYVPHVARIEWLYIEALFSADCEPWCISELAGCTDWTSLYLRLHPATRIDWLTTPAFSIWMAQRQARTGELEVDWHAEGVLVTRPRLEVGVMRLERPAHRLIVGIGLGESVGTAAIAAATLFPETEIGSLFASLCNVGAFAGTIDRSLA